MSRSILSLCFPSPFLYFPLATFRYHSLIHLVPLKPSTLSCTSPYFPSKTSSPKASVSSFGAATLQHPIHTELARLASGCSSNLVTLHRRIDSPHSTMGLGILVRQQPVTPSESAVTTLNNHRLNRPFFNFPIRISRSQSPALNAHRFETAELQRPNTNAGTRGPTRVTWTFENGRGRAKDDLQIVGSTMKRNTYDKELIYFDFPLPKTRENDNTPRQITITSPNDRTTSSSPAPSRLNSRPNSRSSNRYSQQRATRRNDSRDSYTQRYTTRGSRNSSGTRAHSIGGPCPPIITLLASTTIEVQQFPIGMAFGSPSHSPPYFQAMSAPAPPKRSMTMPTEPEHTREWQPAPSTEPLKRSKTAKWKLFGMFGKKSSAPEEGQDGDVQKQAENQGRPTRSKTISGRKLKSQKPRHGLSKVTSGPGEATAVSFMGTRAFEHEVNDVLTRDSMDTGWGGREQPANKYDGMLGVDIPTVHMERYSIMFSQLLEKTQPKSNESTSALLARREATIERLKTVNESIVELEAQEAAQEAAQLRKPRRLTPPAHAPSPSSLLPFRGGKLVTNQLSPRLTRSNSSPALSPTGATFADNLALHSHHVRPHGLPLARVPASPAVVTSPAITLSDDNDPETAPVQGQAGMAQLKPRLIEPGWEMIQIAPVRSRQRANTAHVSSQPEAQRSRANTATSRTSGSSAASNTSAQSAESSATTISTSSTLKHYRSIPKIKIRNKPALEPYPSGIVPAAPIQGLTGPVSAPSISVTEPQTLVDPSTAGWPGSPGLTREIRIPISKFATASRPERKASVSTPSISTSASATSLVPSVNASDAGGGSDAEVHMIKAAEASIARQISISRQQSQMLRGRLAKSRVGVMQQEVVSNKIILREQRGLTPRRMESVNRKSECGALEGFDAVQE